MHTEHKLQDLNKTDKAARLKYYSINLKDTNQPHKVKLKPATITYVPRTCQEFLPVSDPEKPVEEPRRDKEDGTAAAQEYCRFGQQLNEF